MVPIAPIEVMLSDQPTYWDEALETFLYQDVWGRCFFGCNHWQIKGVLLGVVLYWRIFSCFFLRFGSWRPPFLLHWCYCCLNTLHWLQLFSIPHVNISLVPIRGHYTPKSSGLSFCSPLTCLAHFSTHPSQQGWKHGSGFTSLWKGQLPAFKWVLVWWNITFWTKQPIWIQFGRSLVWSALKVGWNITVQGFVPFNPQQ